MSSFLVPSAVEYVWGSVSAQYLRRRLASQRSFEPWPPWLLWLFCKQRSFTTVLRGKAFWDLQNTIFSNYHHCYARSWIRSGIPMNSFVVQASPPAANASNQTRQCRNTRVNGVKGEAGIRDELANRRNWHVQFMAWTTLSIWWCHAELSTCFYIGPICVSNRSGATIQCREASRTDISVDRCLRLKSIGGWKRIPGLRFRAAQPRNLDIKALSPARALAGAIDGVICQSLCRGTIQEARDKP